jgi:hypothetical protein
MNFKFAERERPMHWPTVNADMSETSAFRRAPYAIEHGAGFEKAKFIGTSPSVEKSTAETLNIEICLTSRICERV